MTRASGRATAVGLSLLVGAGLLSGCTSAPHRTTVVQREPFPVSDFRLLAFDSCDTALTTLREAGKASVGPYGLPGQYYGPIFAAREGDMMRSDMAMADAGKAVPAPQAGAADAPAYSGTNNHEAGVDEPDMVKTDGRRVITISGGVLRVIDVASRRLVGKLALTGIDDDYMRYGWAPTNMLFAGDRVLLLFQDPYWAMPKIIDGEPQKVAAFGPTTRVVLVDIAGPPRVVNSYRMDGSMLDAREVGGTARVVVRSSPRLVFPPWREDSTDAKRTTANRRVIDKSTLDDWLPRFEVSTNGHWTEGRVPCDAVARPETFTGANMLSVLTFDLRADALGDGDPLTLVADGDTIYGTGTSLYVASDQSWRMMVPLMVRPDGTTTQTTPPEPTTEIYRFDTSGPGRPLFAAAGSVPGYLINQYAMSEWDGRLRVATTTGGPWRGMTDNKTQSGVYVLEPVGRDLTTVGHVGGLGKGERIYAVRFVGTVGYVVTFRQTDPLYTLDLSEPARPTVRGALKINGYSAYLHPANEGRVIGVGRDANDQGRVGGVQVSLFNVSNLDDPTRVARYTVDNGYSEAEFDPHAFLYWPSDGLLVVPLQTYADNGGNWQAGALVLRVAGDGLDKVGILHQPRGNNGSVISRSLVIDQTLWTISDDGVMVSDSRTLAQIAYLKNR
jgi:uncharacterized secreted protein with C-terminal beta-propeller domain